MRDHGSIGLFLGNSDFGGEFGSECFGLFPFLFFCLVWGWKKSPTHKIFVGSQRERTTSSRGFFSFFCLWQFCTDQILSGPKTFLYIPFILFLPLIGNLSFSFAFFPRLIGNSFFLLTSQFYNLIISDSAIYLLVKLIISDSANNIPLFSLEDCVILCALCSFSFSFWS